MLIIKLVFSYYTNCYDIFYQINGKIKGNFNLGKTLLFEFQKI